MVRIIGSGILTLDPGEDTETPPEFRGDNQSQFVVGNASALADGYLIYLCGDNGKEAIPIPAQQAVIIEGDAKIKIKADANNGAAASYTIGQIFGGKIRLDV